LEPLSFVAEFWLSEVQVPEDELPLPLPPVFEEVDEQVVEPAANAKWFSTICTAKKVRAAAASAMAPLTNIFFAMVTIPSFFLRCNRSKNRTPFAGARDVATT
jgi:hypothetical protein